MILSAGITKKKEFERSDVRNTYKLSETLAREESETPLSEIQLRAHTDTYTLSLLEQITILEKKLAES